MRIGIDARMYGSKQGGLGRYIEQLITGLENTDQNNQYFIFLRSENWSDYTPKNSRFTKVLANIDWYGVAEQTIWPIILYKHRLELVHFPHWNVPLLYRSKYLVTIHDLLLLHHPTTSASTLGPISYFVKNNLFKLVLKNCLYSSKKIITVSEFSKKDIIKTLRIDEKKIFVTYPAVNLESKESKIDQTSILSKYNIKKPFWLYVGVAYPHKNLEKLLDSFSEFVEKNKNYDLVLVGRNNFFYDRLKKLSKTKNYKNVIFTGYVPDSELPQLYRAASLYVFPSLYEGFGIPPLEASLYDLPIISSNTTSMPEILRDGAVFFDPNNDQEMIRAAEHVLQDENFKNKLVSRAKNNLKRFSVNALAEKTLNIYKSV